jgi:hypothetical protein
MRPAACRDQRGEDGNEDGAPEAFARDADLEDVRALLGRPLNPGLQDCGERNYLDMAPQTRV